MGAGLATLSGQAAEGAAVDVEELDPAMATPGPDGNWLWYDVEDIGVEGKGWTDTEHYYDRLPAKAKGVVRDAVWQLSTHSAGLCVRFVTDADTIAARWSLTSSNLGMAHFPPTGVSGVDLYVLDKSAGEPGIWRWIGAGRPDKQQNEGTLARGIPEGKHEFLLYLPLYNGTESAAIGLPPGAVLEKPPARPPERALPIVIYGTSIVQGGCASRPGMAHTSILSRKLRRPVINLGFSGNGQMEMEIGELLAELDVAAYVIDCLPNLKATQVTERTEPFLQALRKARPDTPIVLVENIQYQAGAFLPAARQSYEAKNDALRAAYERLKADGVPGLYYVPCDNLLGDDGEATVDGTHPTDLGFLRMAEAIEPVLSEILNLGLVQE
ncbi:MAG: hypothetical protein GWP08_00785 [Nitrospiraceae bacterium]|nr:hypothetical protein [Nitrospiraceae bacterium]